MHYTEHGILESQATKDAVLHIFSESRLHFYFLFMKKFQGFYILFFSRFNDNTIIYHDLQNYYIDY